MAQLHLYVPDDVAERLRAQAEHQGLSLSKYLAELVTKAVDKGWPAGYFERLAGAWADERFDEPEELPYDRRDWSDF
jgi:hypothetical protein